MLAVNVLYESERRVSVHVFRTFASSVKLDRRTVRRRISAGVFVRNRNDCHRLFVAVEDNRVVVVKVSYVIQERTVDVERNVVCVNVVHVHFDSCKNALRNAVDVHCCGNLEGVVVRQEIFFADEFVIQTEIVNLHSVLFNGCAPVCKRDDVNGYAVFRKRHDIAVHRVIVIFNAVRRGERRFAETHRALAVEVQHCVTDVIFVLACVIGSLEYHFVHQNSVSVEFCDVRHVVDRERCFASLFVVIVFNFACLSVFFNSHEALDVPSTLRRGYVNVVRTESVERVCHAVCAVPRSVIRIVIRHVVIVDEHTRCEVVSRKIKHL